MAQTFNYPLNLVSNTATTISNVFIPSNATIGNVFYNTLTTGNLVVNNVNLGISSLFSGSFIAANNVSTPTAITGLLFSSTNIRYFEIKLTVNINTSVATSLDSVFTIRGNYNDSGWAIITSYIGDVSGVVFSINASGQVLYTSTNVLNFTNSTFRYSVQQFTINGTYTSILGNTVGSYLLDSIQINNTTDSIPGTSNGGLYVLGGATISKQVNINSTNNIIGLGSGGSLTVLGGASISKNLIIGTGVSSIFNSNTLGNLFTTGGNVGIGNQNPAFSLDVSGTGRFTNGFQAIFNSNTIGNLYTTGGNVGISTTTPSYTLDVNGTFRATALNSNGYTPTHTLINTGTSNPSVMSLLTPNIAIGGETGVFFGQSLGNAGQLSYIYNGTGNTGNSVRLGYYGGGTYLNISNSNIGINTANPGYTLDVNGTLRTTAQTGLKTTFSAVSFVDIFIDVSTYSNVEIILYLVNNNTNDIYIQYNSTNNLTEYGAVFTKYTALTAPVSNNTNILFTFCESAAVVSAYASIKIIKPTNSGGRNIVDIRGSYCWSSVGQTRVDATGYVPTVPTSIRISVPSGLIGGSYIIRNVL